MRYIYFGKNKGGNHNGIACVGYELEGERKMKMSFSFCSPNDRFSRKKAHAILDGRMDNDQVVVANTEVKFLKYEEITKIAREFLNNSIEGWKDPKEFTVNNNYKKHKTVGGVNLPWWFKRI